MYELILFIYFSFFVVLGNWTYSLIIIVYLQIIKEWLSLIVILFFGWPNFVCIVCMSLINFLFQIVFSILRSKTKYDKIYEDRQNNKWLERFYQWTFTVCNTCWWNKFFLMFITKSMVLKNDFCYDRFQEKNFDLSSFVSLCKLLMILFLFFCFKRFTKVIMSNDDDFLVYFALFGLKWDFIQS